SEPSRWSPVLPPAPSVPLARSLRSCSRSRAGPLCSAGRSPVGTVVSPCSPERGNDMARWGLLALAVLLLAGPADAKDTVVSYTALEPEQITDYMKAVAKSLPNLDVKMLRLSTGDISARFMAEKDNMQADLVWGVAATNVLVFKNAGLLEPYAPKGLERVQPLFRDKANPPSWVGIDIYMSAFCFNTEVAK